MGQQKSNSSLRTCFNVHTFDKAYDMCLRHFVPRKRFVTPSFFYFTSNIYGDNTKFSLLNPYFRTKIIPDFLSVKHSDQNSTVLTNIALLYYSVIVYLYVNRDSPLEQNKPNRKQIQTLLSLSQPLIFYHTYPYHPSTMNLSALNSFVYISPDYLLCKSNNLYLH